MPRFRSTAPSVSSEWMASGSSGGAKLPHEADAGCRAPESQLVAGDFRKAARRVERLEVADVAAERHGSAADEQPAADVPAPVVLRLVDVDGVLQAVDVRANQPGAERDVRRRAVVTSADQDVSHDRRDLSVVHVNGGGVAEEAGRVAEVHLDAGGMAHEPEAAAERRAVLRGVAAEVDADVRRDESVSACYSRRRDQGTENHHACCKSSHLGSPRGLNQPGTLQPACQILRGPCAGRPASRRRNRSKPEAEGRPQGYARRKCYAVLAAELSSS